MRKWASGGRQPDPRPRWLSELGEGDVLQFLLLHCSLDRLNDVLGLQHAHIPGGLDEENEEQWQGQGKVGTGPMKNREEKAAHQSEDKACRGLLGPDWSLWDQRRAVIGWAQSLTA